MYKIYIIEKLILMFFHNIYFELEKQIINQEELQSSQEKYQQEKIRLETSIQQKKSQK